jgi:rubrerythrin
LYEAERPGSQAGDRHDSIERGLRSPRVTDLEFDLDRYLRASRKVDLSGVAWDRIRDHPVSSGEARCLAYMMDIESHTVIYLRDLLATRAAFEPDVTAFLSCWVYEELWHGEAFSRFLGEAGYELGPDGERVWADSPYPSRSGRNSWIRRKLGAKGYSSHAATLLGAALVRDFVAVQMTWGAVNELSTLNGYHRLIATTRHPVLVDLLERIIKDERRHFAFYRAQARMRLAASRQARKVTRWAMKHLWAPVGTGVRPQSETDFVVSYLFGDDDGLGAAREMDRTIQELPGMAGVRLAEIARDAALSRMRRTIVPSRSALPLAAFHRP